MFSSVVLCCSRKRVTSLCSSRIVGAFHEGISFLYWVTADVFLSLSYDAIQISFDIKADTDFPDTNVQVTPEPTNCDPCGHCIVASCPRVAFISHFCKIRRILLLLLCPWSLVVLPLSCTHNHQSPLPEDKTKCSPWQRSSLQTWHFVHSLVWSDRMLQNFCKILSCKDHISDIETNQNRTVKKGNRQNSA